MRARLLHCLFALLVALDVLACVVWLSLLYPLGLADRPTGHETISAYVGRAASNAMPWGLRAARIIDRVATLLGSEPHHCRRSYLFWSALAR